MKTFRRSGRLAGLLLALIVVYTLGMLAVYSFPDSWIEKNVNAAVAILREEGNMEGGYGTYFWHNGYGITDNLTDKEIYSGLLRDGRSTADAAMRTDYARYWHGYALILRPLMIVFSIINVRFANMMLMFGLFMACCWQCHQKLGGWTAFAFGAGLLTSFILIAPFCQQYCPVYLLTLLASYLLLRFWNRIRKWLPELFLTLGSLVCFFDFLTFPVLALGYPVLICLMLQSREKAGALPMWRDLFVLSAVWMAGYALTWMSKALVGGLLTGQNVLEEILSNVAFRLNGNYANDREVTVWIAVRENLSTYFMGSNVAFWLVCAAAYGLRALLGKTGLRGWIRLLPVLAVICYPFVWYCVLQNHVRMHFWMTYRMLAVSFFALTAYLAQVRDGRRLKG